MKAKLEKPTVGHLRAKYLGKIRAKGPLTVVRLEDPRTNAENDPLPDTCSMCSEPVFRFSAEGVPYCILHDPDPDDECRACREPAWRWTPNGDPYCKDHYPKEV